MSDADDGRRLVIDEIAERIERFRILSGTAHDTDAILEELDARGPREAAMVAELAARPLAYPARFEQAHRAAMRGLEVLDRHGFRSPALPRLGPLRPLAAYLVELMARYIVRSYTATVIDAIRHLYGRREARSRPGTDERRMLARARAQAERLAPGYRGNPNGIPGFLLGAAIPVVATAVRAMDAVDVTSGTFLAVASALSFVLFAIAAWVFLRGAAVARRRIRLALAEPLDALWETVGGCGRPPTDDSRTVAIVAIVLTALGWIVLPVVVGAIVAASR